MARMWKPFFSNCSMMSPTAFFFTASGLTMVNVRCSVFMNWFSVPGSQLPHFDMETGQSPSLDFYAQHGCQRLADVGGRFRNFQAGFLHRGNLFGSSAFTRSEEHTSELQSLRHFG